MSKRLKSPQSRPAPSPAPTPAPAEPPPSRDGALAGALLDPKLRRVLLLIGWMIVAGGSAWAVVLVWPLVEVLLATLSPFVVGVILAYILDPIVTAAQRRLGLSRVAGVCLLYTGIVLLALGFVAMVLPTLVGQVRSAWVEGSAFVARHVRENAELQRIAHDVDAWLRQHGLTWEEIVRRAAQSSEVRSAASSGARLLTGALSGVVEVLGTFVGAIAFWTLTVLVNIYVLVEFSKLRPLLEVLVPERLQGRVFAITAKVDVALGGFLRGMLITAFLVGLMAFVGLYALGLREYALLIGICAGIGNMIPYLGGISAGLPSLLFVAFSSQYEGLQERLIYAALVLLLVGIIQAVDGFVFQPRIIGQSAQLHPVAVLFALALGANFGLLGMILAVPLACIARVVVKELYWDEAEAAWRARTGAESLSEAALRSAGRAPAREKRGKAGA